MAELLIKAQDNTHADPVKNERGCYKRGDIVDVRPDGFAWGKEECLPRFVVVKIPGLDHAKVRHFIEAHFDTTNPDAPVLMKRRKWNVLMDAAKLPAWVKTSLRDTGSVTVTVAQVRNFIQNKITLEKY